MLGKALESTVSAPGKKEQKREERKDGWEGGRKERTKRGKEEEIRNKACYINASCCYCYL